MNLLIITGIFPPDIGGPANYVPRLARELVARGHGVEILCLADQPAKDNGTFAFPVRRIRRGISFPIRFIRVVITGCRLARKKDLLFVNGLFSESAMISLITGTSMAHKVVGDPCWERARNKGWYKDTLDRYQVGQKGFLLRVLDRIRNLAFTRSQKIIVPSRYMSSIVGHWGIPDQKVEVIYNAVPLIPKGARRSELPPFPGPTLCTVCRLVPWKGLDALIRMLEKLPEVRLAVVGDGPLLPELSALAERARVRERVLFMGNLARDRVESVLLESDIFLLNSSYEGLPHVVLEAMAAGTPVIATRVGGTPEVVDHGVTGLLVPPGDDASLYESVVLLLKDRKLAVRLADNAKERLAQHFEEREMIKQTETALMSLVGQPGQSTGVQTSNGFEKHEGASAYPRSKA